MVKRTTGFGGASPVVIVPKSGTLRKFNKRADLLNRSQGRKVGELGNASLGTGTGGDGSGGFAHAQKAPVVKPGAGLLGTKANRGNITSARSRKPAVIHASDTPKAGTSQLKY